VASRGWVSRAVIRTAAWIGLAALMGGCAARGPFGASFWGSPQSASPATPESLLDASVTDRPLQAQPVAKGTLLVDDPPSHVSQGKAVMTRPPRVKARQRPGRPYHPDPRIVIDVLEGRGAASADLQRTARDAGYWPFRRCYEDGLRRDQELSGKVSLALSISASGHVERSSVTSSSLRDKTVMACLAREARMISFSSADSEALAAADISLAVGDEPVAVTLPVAGAEALRRALRVVWPAAQECYSLALARDAQVGGRLELFFRVDLQGQVAEVSEGSPHLADSDLRRCVLDTYRGARLGLGDATHERRFVYSLHFETDLTPSAPEQP
jgi:hypothetical protein